ncbi:MAG: VOC family protein [Fimbriimonadaceae bacterium]
MTSGKIIHMSKNNQISHWEIGVPESSVEFYQSLFGWSAHEPDELNYRSAEGSGLPGGFLLSDEPFVQFYVRVEDIEDAIHKAELAGGKVIHSRRKVPDIASWYAVITDPLGNRVGLFSEGPAKQ